MKGKTVRTKPTELTKDIISIPKEVQQKGQNIEIHMDTLYINGVPFLLTIGYPIYYCKCTPLDNIKYDDYYKVINKTL